MKDGRKGKLSPSKKYVTISLIIMFIMIIYATIADAALNANLRISGEALYEVTNDQCETLTGMKGYGPANAETTLWPTGYTHGNDAFNGGIFDGQNIWMIPQNADRLIKIIKDTGVMTGYGCDVASGCVTGSQWPTGYTTRTEAFYDGVFDGQNIWMIPYYADRVIKINKDTGVMTGYGCTVASGCVAGSQWPGGSGNGPTAFKSGVFDDQNIWMIPFDASRVIKIDKDTGAMTGYGCAVASGCVEGSQWPTGYTKGTLAFNDGVFDGQNIWMIPYNSDRVIKINKDTGVMTGYGCTVASGCVDGSQWPTGYTKGTLAFNDGVFDGQNIWMIPNNSDRVIKINKDTGVMTGYGCDVASGCAADSQWPTGYTKGTAAFSGGIFDNKNIWMMPYDSDRAIKINKDTGIMTGYGPTGTNILWPTNYTKGTAAFYGGVFDAQNIWMIPHNSDRIIEITSGASLQILTNTLLGGTVGFSYDQILSASGSAPMTWILDSGQLPPGLSLSSEGGISGMPTTVGTYNFTVKVTDCPGSITTKDLQIVISQISLVNLVQNGSFETGSGGVWLPSIACTYAALPAPHGGYGSLAAYVNASGTADVYWYLGAGSKISVTSGNKYYVTALGYTANTNITGVSIYDYITALSPAITTTLSPNTWGRVSGVWTAPAGTTALQLAVFFTRSSGKTQKIVYADNIMMIDLTAAYGAGNEPTAAEMDTIINNNGGYWDGSKALQ